MSAIHSNNQLRACLMAHVELGGETPNSRQLRVFDCIHFQGGKTLLFPFLDDISTYN